eukprot:1920673-Ditylum_brightwellii.AAC.1
MITDNENNKQLIHTSHYANSISKHETAFIDSGASDNYLHPDSPYHNTKTKAPPIAVGEPGCGTMQSARTGKLKCQNVPEEAREAHVLPGLQTSITIVGKLCDANCFAIFTQDDVQIYKIHQKPQQCYNKYRSSDETCQSYRCQTIKCPGSYL